MPVGLKRADSVLSSRSNNKKGYQPVAPEQDATRLTRRASLTRQASLMGNQMDVSPRATPNYARGHNPGFSTMFGGQNYGGYAPAQTTPLVDLEKGRYELLPQRMPSLNRGMSGL